MIKHNEWQLVTWSAVVAVLVCVVLGVGFSVLPAAPQTTTSTSRPVTYNNQCERTAISQVALVECVASELKQLQTQLASALTRERIVFGRKLVDAAQLQWTKFVSVDCKMYANPNRNGTIYPLLLEKCQRDLTVERIEEVRQDIASQPQ
jgi:uncharacterized protein YecT (DUF1311 family)